MECSFSLSEVDFGTKKLVLELGKAGSRLFRTCNACASAGADWLAKHFPW